MSDFELDESEGLDVRVKHTGKGKNMKFQIIEDGTGRVLRTYDSFTQCLEECRGMDWNLIEDEGW
jgi:hypothetical protein